MSTYNRCKDCIYFIYLDKSKVKTLVIEVKQVIVDELHDIKMGLCNRNDFIQSYQALPHIDLERACLDFEKCNIKEEELDTDG